MATIFVENLIESLIIHIAVIRDCSYFIWRCLMEMGPLLKKEFSIWPLNSKWLPIFRKKKTKSLIIWPLFVGFCSNFIWWCLMGIELLLDIIFQCGRSIQNGHRISARKYFWIKKIGSVGFATPWSCCASSYSKVNPKPKPLVHHLKFLSNINWSDYAYPRAHTT